VSGVKHGQLITQSIKYVSDDSECPLCRCVID